MKSPVYELCIQNLLIVVTLSLHWLIIHVAILLKLLLQLLYPNARITTVQTKKLKLNYSLTFYIILHYFTLFYIIVHNFTLFYVEKDSTYILQSVIVAHAASIILPGIQCTLNMQCTTCGHRGGSLRFGGRVREIVPFIYLYCSFMHLLCYFAYLPTPGWNPETAPECTSRPSKPFASADCDTIYTIPLYTISWCERISREGLYLRL